MSFTVLTVVTKTHEQLFMEHFLPSFSVNKDISLVVEFMDDSICPTGEFMSQGFNEMCSRKALTIARHVNKCGLDNVLLYVDVDCRFYSDSLIKIAAMLWDKKKHVLFQDDGGKNCGCGVILMRCSPEVEAMFAMVGSKTNKYRDDQEALNTLLNSGWFQGVKVGFLPNTFYTVGPHCGYWPEDKPTKLPEGMVLHHANFTNGVKNKNDLLNFVCKLQSQS